MSLYSQNVYGQPPYGGPSYTQPPVFRHYYSHPPTSVSYPNDAASFRRDFAARLTELTFNSRPIIQQLSMFAQDYSRFSDIVGQCLEGHIRSVPQWIKLPAFYLLDAISKNVYDPYARQFSSFVVQLFLETYPQVDVATQGKMDEMLLTWRTGSPTGKELFGSQQQIAIERGIWGVGITNDTLGSNFRSGLGFITKSQVLSELQFTLGQKERTLQTNPYDTVSQNHRTILNQLRLHVEAGVSQEELQQILVQLRNLAKNSPQPVSQPAVLPAPSWQSHPPFPPQLTMSSLSQQFIGPSSIEKVEDHLNSGLANAASTMPPADNIANLLSTLLKAGVVSASGTTSNSGIIAIDKDATTELDDEYIREYRSSILSESVSLNTLDSLRVPRIVEFLYDRQSLQCKQCGLRFPDTDLGKRNQNNHLDMHFRQNRKANEDVGRGHSRSLFVRVEDWTRDISGENKEGKGSGDISGKAGNANREADLLAQFVVVPPGEEAQVVSCPVCKESFKSEFLDENEDWVWKNAVKKEDRIYHATCYAEAITSTSTLAVRFRKEKNRESRSATPEIHAGVSGVRASPSPRNIRVSRSKSPSLPPLLEPKVTGTKRKAENKDFNDQEGTPPSKKVALSSISTVPS